MRKPIARKALECREFDTEFQQVVVTRVPERFPDVNIRTALEKIGHVQFEREGIKGYETDRQGGRRWFSGKRTYLVRL